MWTSAVGVSTPSRSNRTAPTSPQRTLSTVRRTDRPGPVVARRGVRRRTDRPGPVVARRGVRRRTDRPGPTRASPQPAPAPLPPARHDVAGASRATRVTGAAVGHGGRRLRHVGGCAGHGAALGPDAAPTGPTPAVTSLGLPAIRRPTAAPAARGVGSGRAPAQVAASTSPRASSARSTTTRPPSRTSPASSIFASRSPISRCTRRRSGRAP